MAGKPRKRYRNKHIPQPMEAKKQKIETIDEEASNIDVNDSLTKSNFSEKLKRALKVDMPDDFYNFYDLCKDLNPTSITAALVESLKLELCGPYDIISGKLSVENSKSQGQIRIIDTDNKETTDENEGGEEDGDLKFHLHSRFYYDPPEFMTVIKDSSSNSRGFHIGYFRDDPDKLPSFVATNNADADCIITPCGDNIFAAVNSYAQSLLTNTKGMLKKTKLQGIVKKLKDVAKKFNYNLETVTSKAKERKAKVVTKSFHKAGIVVPLDGKEVGYRPLNLTDNSLKKLLDKICDARDEQDKNKYLDELHDLITLVQFANDECDYGMGLELGIDLFCYGNEAFKGHILQLLPLAYSLLDRELYGKIIERHMEKRERLIDEA